MTNNPIYFDNSATTIVIDIIYCTSGGCVDGQCSANNNKDNIKSSNN